MSLIKKDDIVAVGLSGGKDSVCLLHLLLAVSKKEQFTVKAINVEHGIRGESSVSDSNFVKNLCSKLNVPLKSFSVDVPLFAEQNKLSEETAGRILRYQCFDECLKSGFCNKIATAHHAGDNAETVLMNLFRGTGLSGMAGIKKEQAERGIIRPILSLTREEIDNYINENNLPYVHDCTNDDNLYTRNFVRNEVLPLVESRFSGAEEAINRFSLIAEMEDNLLNYLSDSLICGNKVKFTDEISKPLFLRACLKQAKKLGFIKDFESGHLYSLLALKNSQTGAKVDLKGGITVYRDYDGVVFKKESKEREGLISSYFCDYSLGKIEFFDYIIKSERADSYQKDGALYFDLDKIPENAIIRTRREGDLFVTFSGKTKTLKKYLTDKKVPARISKNLPVIASGNNVYVILGVEISALCKVTEQSANIIRITLFTKGE